MSLLDKINGLRSVHSLSKHEQLVHGVIEAIDEGILATGDQLPSINRMVADLGYARKTIVKAYEELKERGLVESKKLKGYFIISEETQVTLKIALLLFSFHRFQEEFYNTLREELGKRFQIDVFFHHNNIAVFETIFKNIKGKYGKYVVAPIPDPKIRPLLAGIDPQKLLVIDRYLEMDDTYSYISQEFEEGTYHQLVELLPDIKKYERFVLFFRDDADYPNGIRNAFTRFLSDHAVVGSVQRRYGPEALQKGTAYFFISDTFLWDVLRDCSNKGYVLGRDVGILSHNDHVVKEILLGGITTISTDFRDMAVRAANHVKNQSLTREFMPINLIKRGSL